MSDDLDSLDNTASTAALEFFQDRCLGDINMQPQAYIFDLDGLILDTESLCVEIASQVLKQRNVELTKEAQRAALGKRPLDCWRDVIHILGIHNATAEELFEETEPLLQARWSDVKTLPGAVRLLGHLKSCNAMVAIATSTSRATFNKKLANKPYLQQMFQASVCGDEVVNGKPAADVFLAAAQQLGVPASSCVCFEDAPSGVEGAVAAGMKVVMVPSVIEGGHQDPSAGAAAASNSPGGVIQVLPSLLAFDPTSVGLPPFADLLHGVIPLETVFKFKGTVVPGFGRGSKELGIPTANVDADSLRHSIAEAVTGIYCGWASIGSSSQVYQMVMSIGWNPFYGNKEKTAEPWILHTFDEPFYGQEIRLVVCGYVRPEANFTSLEALITRIHKDAQALLPAALAADLG
eukprot:gene9054-9224_t